MTVKIYDKIIDLVTRDGCKLIGSRCNVLLGAKHEVSAFMQRLRRCQNHGMTRIEVSVFVPPKQGLCFTNTRVFMCLPASIGSLIMTICNDVLNAQPIRRLIYRRTSVENLMARFAAIEQNYLLVGDQRCWMVTARGASNQQFVGTERLISTKNLGSNTVFWDRLKNLVARFASPGATILVYYLHSSEDLVFHHP